jgi:vitamin B12/bleomycin/antimicrobial peptide transport system ATP-binding/permease protein
MVGGTQANALGRQSIARVGGAIRNFAASEVGGRAVAMAGVLVALLIVINGLNVVNSYVGRDFMTAIEHRDPNGFVALALFYAGVFAASTIAAVMYRFTEERLGLCWREWLTRRVVGVYLEGRRYYLLQVGEGLTNPDERIADDVRSFTTSTLSLFLIFMNGTFTLVAFSGVLWSISRTLFGVAVAYAALGSLLAILLGRPLVQLNYDQADREADFRAALVGVRENAESIAIAHGEPLWQTRLRRHVDGIVTNLRRIIAVNRNLNFFTTGYNYMIQLIPALIVAPLFIRGTAEFGVITQSSMAFAQVLGAFSLIVNQFPMLSSYAAIVARLSVLVDATEATEGRAPAAVVITPDETRLAFERLTLRTPRDGRPLVRELSVEVKTGGRLLVRGPGDATAALLRAVDGLWEAGEGRVVRPPGAGVLVLPDRPYLLPGTLREVLLGSDGGANVPDHRIRGELRAAGLDGVVERAGGLDVELGRDALSLEEQLLVGVARVLLAVPRFAVLARLEAGVGTTRAAEVLGALAAHGIGYVVLGDDTADQDFDAVVDIAPDGTWTRSATEEVSA